MSKAYRVTKQKTAVIDSGYTGGKPYHVGFRERRWGFQRLAFNSLPDAERALAALAREFGWEEVRDE